MSKLSEVSETWARIRPFVHRTPVMTSDLFGMPIEFKLEQLQHTGSFKARGAMNSVLSMDVPAAGLVAASGGNHGAAVAWAAAQRRHNARIYVPELAGPSKINLIRGLGADLVVVPGAYADAAQAAADYQSQTGAAQIHAYDAPLTVAGQATVMAEWADQGLNADTILIAVGGGGLIAGAMTAALPGKKIVGVEPEQAATLTNALAYGPDHATEVSGVAANALGARQIGRICYDLAVSSQLQTVTVSDAAITDAQQRLWSDMRQLVEPAGATALAAIISGAYQPAPGEKVAILLCGANIAPDPFA